MFASHDPVKMIQKGSRSKSMEKSNDNNSLVKISHVFTTLILPRWKILSLGLILIVINRICYLILPSSSNYLIDNVIQEKSMSLSFLITVVCAAVFVQSVSSYFLTLLLSVEAHGLIAKLRTKIQSHIIYLPTQYFDNTKVGIQVSRVMNDVEGVRNLVGTGLVMLIGGVFQSIIAFFILLNYNSSLTLISILPLIVFGFVSMNAFKYIRPIFRERGRIVAEVTGRLTESLSGIRVIKGFNAEEREKEIFANGAQRIFENVKKSLSATSLVTSASVLLLGITSAIIMYYGGTRILEGSMTVGDFVAFTLTLGFMVTPIVQMTNIGTQITEAMAGLDRMEEVLQEKREIDHENRTVSLNGIVGDVSFRDVWFSYDEDQDVIQGISFDAPRGSVTALVGSSGSGKSTIANLAACYLTPKRGSITIDGIDLANVKVDTYRRQLGVVLQDDFLFDGTIRENIMFSNPEASEDELQTAVESAHVKEFSDRFDDGIETVIGERGVKLSGGQKQRIAIARALVANPRILILDEATSSLDNESEKYIQSSLETLMKGRTTFVIAHRLSTIRRADQILVIEDGKIVERGNHQDLIDRQGRYYELYTYQSRI